MTESEAIGYMENEIRCIQRSNYCDRDCKNCNLVKDDEPLIESYGIAINALEKQIPKKPIFQFNLSDTVSRFECRCGKIIKVRHDIGIMDNNNAPNYCDNCGQKLDWSDEE